MQAGKFNVVTDGQWGSCGKGRVATALAAIHKPKLLSTTNMANAGHTAIHEDGRKFVAKALPSTAILRKWIPGYWPCVFVGASAAFHLDTLLREFYECEQPLVLIHDRAGVITGEHQARESGHHPAVRDSTRHIASTMQGCGAFLADKIMRRPDLKLARDYADLTPFRIRGGPDEFTRIIHGYLDQGATMLHEGSQGFSLDINHGSHYPHCTSRGTTATQNLADMGINPRMLGDVYLVIRPYPIRVGNVTDSDGRVHSSGDCYPDQRETTWERVAADAGMPASVAESLKASELTTVTKRLRRVFTFSREQVCMAAITNGATKLVLNFADYIDYAIHGKRDKRFLTSPVLAFIDKLQNDVGLPVVCVGTGPRITDEIRLD